MGGSSVTRRDFIKMTMAAGATSMATPWLFQGCGGGNPSKSTADGTPYNILWLIGDDLSPDLNCYGDTTVSTPNIDRLANEGVVFTNAFCPMSQCAPARSSVFTGMYPTSIGTHHMRSRNYPGDTDKSFQPVPPENVKIFSEYLRAAGYFCTQQNKLDYQFGDAFSAWDIATQYLVGETAASITLPGETAVQYEGYEGLWNRREEGQPFFSVINFPETHEHFTWDKTVPDDNPWKFMATWEAGEVPDDVDPADVPLPPYYPDDQTIREDMARMYHQIGVMDRNIGRILYQLETDGLLDNTIIVFFGDGGRGLPRSKRWCYDDGLKVPLIVRWPGQNQAGTRIDDLVSFVDFAPTILSILGMGIPSHMQGQAFLGNEADEPRQYIYAGRDRSDVIYDKFRVIRDSRYKYIRNYHPEIPYSEPISYRDAGATWRKWKDLYDTDPASLTDIQKSFFSATKPEEELYDIENDPYEVDNLAADPDYADILARMREAIDEWIDETDVWADKTGTKTDAEMEAEMVETMWPGHIQPVTNTPALSTGDAQSGNSFDISITSTTPGASVIYSILQEESETPNWKLYSQPLSISSDCIVKTRALRYGYAVSDEASATYRI